MGLYRCLPYLVQSGMGAGKTLTELESERSSVIGARCWLAVSTSSRPSPHFLSVVSAQRPSRKANAQVYKSEFEMAFNLGRPGLFSAEDTIRHGREFLLHPLTNAADARLVAVCELLTLRMPMHQPFSLWPSMARIPDLDARIADANAQFVAWFAHWDEWFGESARSACSRLLIPGSIGSLPVDGNLADIRPPRRTPYQLLTRES